MSIKNIILYDLNCKPKPVCMSPNVWKTRMTLNYKQLPYETKWLEYPNVEPTLKPHVESPYGGKYILDYTVPAIVLPDGTYIMESLAIAKELERLFPSRRLVLEEATILEALNTVDSIVFRLVPLGIHTVAETLITERSYDYFVKARTAWCGGVALADVQAAAKKDECLEKARPHLETLIEMLSRNTDGPYVHGKDVGFADFAIVGMWKMFQYAVPVVRGEIMDANPIFKRHYEACQSWLDREDY